MSIIDKTKQRLENKRSSINDQAEKLVLKEIERLCRLNKWEFSSVYGMKISDKHHNELYDTEIDVLVEWLEDNFCLLGAYVFTKGRWRDGTTTLITFSKPSFK